MSVLPEPEEEVYITLMEELGHYQDITISINLLNTKGIKIDLLEIETLKKIKKKWKTDKKVCKKQIINKLNVLTKNLPMPEID
jgi:hypothetical protein